MSSARSEAPVRRVLLKLSGEALGGQDGAGLAPAAVSDLCRELKAFVDAGGELGIVVGGGNLLRGATLAQAGLPRVSADHMGMLATVMNGIAMASMLAQTGAQTALFASVAIPGIAPGYSRTDALSALADGKVCFFTGGTGNPLFTTDTAACLRAIEIDADLVLKATKVDGVYTADPKKDPSATRYEALTYQQVLDQGLAVMDQAAICLCQEHDMPLVVFDMSERGALEGIIGGAAVGTRIS
ncbi:MAG: UMP kinase [Pseudomonadota bacterium]